MEAGRPRASDRGSGGLGQAEGNVSKVFYHEYRTDRYLMTAGPPDRQPPVSELLGDGRGPRRVVPQRCRRSAARRLCPANDEAVEAPLHLFVLREPVRRYCNGEEA